MEKEDIPNKAHPLSPPPPLPQSETELFATT